MGSRHGGAAPAAARSTPRAPPSLRQFRCIFRDALLDSHKEYQYWAASEYEAAEIVAKINYLIQMHAKGASVKAEARAAPACQRRGSCRASMTSRSSMSLRDRMG